MVWQGEVAHQMALVPLATGVILVLRGRKLDAGWWWILAGFAVSWCADTATDLLPRQWSFVAGIVYPAPQAALIGRVFLSRRESLAWLALLTCGAVFTVLTHGATTPEYLFRAFAWIGLVGLAAITDAPYRLRLALAVYFGLGWVAWWVHTTWLVVPTWYPYQACRLAGLLLASWALWTARAPLRLLK